MEIPARYFFFFCAVIGFTFLQIGLDAMEKTELSNTVPSSVMSLFKLSLYILAGCFLIKAVGYPSPELDLLTERHTIVFVVIVSLVLNTFEPVSHANLVLFIINSQVIVFLFLYFFEANLSPNANMTIRLLNLLFLLTIVFVDDRLNLPAVVIQETVKLISPTWFGNVKDKILHKYLLPITASDPTQENLFIFNKTKCKRWIEFAVGMVGSILFQNFFRLNSFKEVLAFIYLAVSWLATLVFVLDSRDFGLFNFLLGNVIIGSTVNESGLGRNTWIAYGTCLVLYALRLKLESLSLVNREGEETKVVIW